MLSRIDGSEGGTELLDVLMKYLCVCPANMYLGRSANEFTQRYKGMSHHSQPTSASTRGLSPQPTGFSQIHSRGGGEGGGQAMSVLLSWHERLVEIAGAGCIVRVMTDRRTV